MAPETALAQLHSGVSNRYDRARRLRVLAGQQLPDARWRVIAAAAALALEDRAACARLASRPGPEQVVLAGKGVPWSQDETAVVAIFEIASFGEHWLRHFLLGQWLRAKGDPRAVGVLAQAARAAGWSEVVLAAELARAGG
jgi:hypothetical protein